MRRRREKGARSTRLSFSVEKERPRAEQHMEARIIATVTDDVLPVEFVPVVVWAKSD